MLPCSPSLQKAFLPSHFSSRFSSIFPPSPEKQKKREREQKKREQERRRMPTESPVLLMLQPHDHFSDYGFDPEIDFFQVSTSSLLPCSFSLICDSYISRFVLQVLGEAGRHGRDASRSMDPIHFKLRKPISKDDHHHHLRGCLPLKKRRWWRSSFLFFRGRWASKSRRAAKREEVGLRSSPGGTRASFEAAVAAPLYLVESRSESSTRSRMSRKPRNGGLKIPCPRELSMEHNRRVSPSAAMPIYLVT